MPRVPRSVIDAYTEQINAISGQNRAALERALEAVDWDADVAIVREQLVGIMNAYCGAAAEQSAMVTSVFYDGLREMTIGEQLGALAESRREPKATEGAVRAFVQDLVDGKGPEPVKRKCLDRLDYETKRSAAECVDYNARRDRKKPRYARVPSGTETCDFCIMLASRGPVYHTERSAGAFDHFHANCDCRVVPMWDTYEIGPSRRASATTEVEGYDPDALYEQYVQMMTNPKFRDRMARAADRARGGDGNAKGSDTSHPMVWAEAKRKGLVKFGSVGEIQDYIRGAKSYEDLMERITLVGKEWDQYALSDSYAEVVRKTMRDTRNRILGYEGEYKSNNSNKASTHHFTDVGEKDIRTIRVGRSVGAKALNDYIVNMPNGDETRFFPESDIVEEQIFAGAGSQYGKELRVRFRLADEYGDDPENWSHVSGEGWVFDPIDGRIRRAEVHWMQSPEVGIHEIWWKRWRS